jgi:hypothetical protein
MIPDTIPKTTFTHFVSIIPINTPIIAPKSGCIDCSPVAAAVPAPLLREMIPENPA